MNKRRKGIVIAAVAIVLIVAAFALAYPDTFAHANKTGDCRMSENSGYVSVNPGFYQVQGTDIQLYLLRGIALGAPYDSGHHDSEDIIPPCFSTEPGLSTVGNVFLVDQNGSLIALVKGVVGSGESVPDPLP